MKIEIVEQRPNTQELLPQIVDRIFNVCKTDPNFHLKDELEIIEGKSKSILEKIKKQDDLLKQSKELINDLTNKVTDLNDSVMKKQMELLEQLGSEL